MSRVELRGRDLGFPFSLGHEGFPFSLGHGRSQRSTQRPRHASTVVVQGYLAHKKSPTPLWRWKPDLAGHLLRDPGAPSAGVQGYLAHKKSPTPLGPP